MNNMSSVSTGGNSQPVSSRNGTPNKAADSKSADDFSSEMSKSKKGDSGEPLSDKKSSGNFEKIPAENFEKTSTGKFEKRAEVSLEKKSDHSSNSVKTTKNSKDGEHKTENMEEDMTEKSPSDLIRSLSQGKTTAPANITTTETAAVQKTDLSESVDKINKIVDRIMLAEAGSTKEARISFNQDFMPGTEVMIRKEGGQLSVEFTTTSAESFDFLNKNEQLLMTQLQNKFGDAAVSVNMQESQMEQQEDGRSRNEFVAEEDDDEKENS